MTIRFIVGPPIPSRLRHLAAGSLALAGVLAPILVVPSTGLAAQQVRVNLRPTVTWTEWDETLGLGDARSLGISAGLGFGEYVDLAGYFRKSDDRSTHLSGLPFAAGVGTPLADQHLQIASYGAELAIGLARGSFVPVVVGGAGILRLRPEFGDEIQRVQLKYGVGFRTRVLGAFDGEVVVERSRYYLDPLDLAVPVSVGDPALPEDPGAGTLRRNLSLRVGLGLELGGRDDYGRWQREDDPRYRRSPSSAALTLEPFGGGQAFDESFGIDDQGIAGFRAGFDVGRSLGLRGFYWRGVEDGYSSWEEDAIRGYGGEALFNLGGFGPFSPHLLAGAGRMEFGPDLVRGREAIPADRTALILGGGIELGLGRHLRLTAAARDHIMSGPDLDAAAVDFEDVRDPRHLVHNWQMSAGLKILVGGDRGRRRPDFGRRDLAEMEDRLADRVDARLDEMERRMGETARDEAGAAVEAEPQGAPLTPVEPGYAPTPIESRSEPAPTEVEPAPALIGPEPVPIEPDFDLPEQVYDGSRLDPALGFPAHELRPYTGVLGGPHTQWIFGVAADWGPSDRLTAFNFVPEASLSLGQGKPSWLVAANLQYRPPWLYRRDSWWISPVTSFGLGVLNQDGSELVLNASWGVNVQLSHVRGVSGEPLNLYIAHQGIDLFRKERLILGMSVER